MSDAPAPEPHCADRIDDLARRVERLTISRHDPEAFFEERSEISHALRREAGALRTVRPAANDSVPTGPKRTRFDIGGR